MNLSLPPGAAPLAPVIGKEIYRKVHAAVARATRTLSVASGLVAAADGGINPLVSPAKRPRMGPPKTGPLNDAPGPLRTGEVTYQLLEMT